MKKEKPLKPVKISNYQKLINACINDDMDCVRKVIIAHNPPSLDLMQALRIALKQRNKKLTKYICLTPNLAAREISIAMSESFTIYRASDLTQELKDFILYLKKEEDIQRKIKKDAHYRDEYSFLFYFINFVKQSSSQEGLEFLVNDINLPKNYVLNDFYLKTEFKEIVERVYEQKELKEKSQNERVLIAKELSTPSSVQTQIIQDGEMVESKKFKL